VASVIVTNTFYFQ